MDLASITTLADEHLENAAAAPSGRSSVTIYGRSGARLRQTLTALDGGRAIGEHKSPGDASLLCLRGRIVLRAGGASTEIGSGELIAIPPQRHDVEALEPSVLLLSVALH